MVHPLLQGDPFQGGNRGEDRTPSPSLLPPVLTRRTRATKQHVHGLKDSLLVGNSDLASSVGRRWQQFGGRGLRRSHFSRCQQSICISNGAVKRQKFFPCNFFLIFLSTSLTSQTTSAQPPHLKGGRTIAIAPSDLLLTQGLLNAPMSHPKRAKKPGLKGPPEDRKD